MEEQIECAAVVTKKLTPRELHALKLETAYAYARIVDKSVQTYVISKSETKRTSSGNIRIAARSAKNCSLLSEIEDGSIQETEAKNIALYVPIFKTREETLRWLVLNEDIKFGLLATLRATPGSYLDMSNMTVVMPPITLSTADLLMLAQEEIKVLRTTITQRDNEIGALRMENAGLKVGNATVLSNSNGTKYKQINPGENPKFLCAEWEGRHPGISAIFETCGAMFDAGYRINEDANGASIVHQALLSWSKGKNTLNQLKAINSYYGSNFNTYQRDLSAGSGETN